MKTETQFDCPWCADTMTSTDATIDSVSDAFACSTCSIVVELAPDPVTAPLARAA